MVFAFLGNYPVMGMMTVLMFALLGFYFQAHATLKTFTFTCWVFAFFIGALVFPKLFIELGGFKLSLLIVPLIQIIMFGMGATLSLDDFARALKMPKAVGLGMLLQFTIMPISGWVIATMFGFDPEVAAGIILIGSCSGGVASNVMVYLSNGNVALSVTMTACSTIAAPLMTPFAMKLLAGRLIEIKVWAMMLSIINLIILPIAAGLITYYLLHSQIKGKIWRPIALVLAVVCYFLAQSIPAAQTQLNSLCGAFLLMALLRQQWLDKGLPLVSMGGIIYIIAIIAAGSRTQILSVGIGLFGAALIHNLIGYLLGYYGARAARLSEPDCRTVAFEVGMQNGGMGTALAIDVLKSTSAALGPVIFGTWMNITGSILASYWKGRIPDSESEKAATD
ncbi:MAG: bile acid:sodium symporter family protein [Verrucomicrobia bacterium]|nr:bile acid:sodium symporter family protein [Verrucomicrobiota bacterium]MDA1068186.1 bile acid:sodium symporter family protein [Verrucomicrobiota bacterium]